MDIRLHSSSSFLGEAELSNVDFEVEYAFKVNFKYLKCPAMSSKFSIHVYKQVYQL